MATEGKDLEHDDDIEDNGVPLLVTLAMRLEFPKENIPLNEEGRIAKSRAMDKVMGRAMSEAMG